MNQFEKLNIGDMVNIGCYRREMKQMTREDAYEMESVEDWFAEEPIEWRVLAKKGDRLLLISKESLDGYPYCKDKNSKWTCWEKSSLREWLNTTFYETAFSKAEREIIVPTILQTPDNPIYRTHDGSETEDKVFILDSYEAERYFKEASERFTWVTTYAYTHGAYGNPENKRCLWRLRTLGKTTLMTAVVDDLGEVDYYGDSALADYVGIRPAMWIKCSGN